MNRPWFPLYVADYLADNVDLSPLEHGVFMLLLMHCWRLGGTLPNDLKKLYRLCGAVNQCDKRAVKKVSETRFSVAKCGTLLSSKRLSEELAKSLKISETNRTNVLRRYYDPSTKRPTQSQSQLQTPKKEKVKKEKVSDQAPLVLPSWMPLEAWNGYRDMRKKIGKPLTDHAVVLAIRKIDAMRTGGEDVEAILNQSTLNSWQGLFPVKGNGSTKTMPMSFDQKREQDAFEAKRRFVERRENPDGLQDLPCRNAAHRIGPQSNPVGIGTIDVLGCLIKPEQ